MLVQILCDNPNSWVVPYAGQLRDALVEQGVDARLIHLHEEVVKGDILCLLGCEKIFRQLELNQHNLVVHESHLPQGKGWSPLTWQILEGKNEIPVTLFEATEAVDAGDIYLKEIIQFKGTELLEELKHEQGEATKRLILNFVQQYPNVKGQPQEGEESFYPRRGPDDSELDPQKSLAEQFELLRVCDNERYPAFFHYRGEKYYVKIEKDA